MRVLLIKTSSMGDVIHSLPALTDAARAYPGIRFDWLVEEAFAEIPTWHPAVAEVIPVAIRRWRKQFGWSWRNAEWKTCKERLKSAKYDLVIDAQGLIKSAWLSRYVGTGTPVAGLDRHSAREPLASYFYQRRFSVPWGQHAVERVRQLFAQALDYPLPEGLGDYGLQRSRLLDAPPRAPYLLFLHGTTWASKHWPETYWRALLEQMSAAGWAVQLPWGNAAEQQRAERLAVGLPQVSVLPRLSLQEMAKVLAGAAACVAVDTGLGHLAAALDVPTLSLFGATDPQQTGAYGRSQLHLASDWSCAPCLQKNCRYRPTLAEQQQFDIQREQPLCFTRVHPQRVVSHLQQLLALQRTP